MAGTVTVACKLPNGLQLQLQRFEERPSQIYGGGVRMERIAIFYGPVVIVGGTASPYGMHPKHRMSNGYALTPNVDAEFFAKWVEQNKELEVVEKQMIFAMAKDDSLVSKTKEMEKVRTGLEPVDPENPPAAFRKIKKWDGKDAA